MGLKVFSDAGFRQITRAALDALAGSSGILPGVPYLISDESNRIAVGLTSTTYKAENRIIVSPTDPTTGLQAGDLWIQS